MAVMTNEERAAAKHMLGGELIMIIRDQKTRVSMAHDILAGQLGGSFNNPLRRKWVRQELEELDRIVHQTVRENAEIRRRRIKAKVIRYATIAAVAALLTVRVTVSVKQRA